MFFFKKFRRNPDIFVSLGGGFNQLPLINAARNLGFRVICVDRETHAPGMLVADIRIQESIANHRDIFTKLGELLLDGRIRGVLSRSHGEAVKSVAWLNQRYHIPFLPVESAEAFLSKKKMKAVYRKLEIETPDQFSLSEGRKAKLVYPFIIKPVEGHAKEGIRLISNESELKSWLKIHSSSIEMIGERYIEGEEVVALGQVHAGRFHLAILSDKIRTAPPYFVDLRHLAPSKYAHRWSEIEAIGQKLAEHFSMRSSPLVMEFIFDAQECLHLIEAAPEFGGEFIADYLLPACTGYSIFEQAILSLTRRKFSPPARKSRSCGVISYLTANAGIITSLEPSVEPGAGLLFAKALKNIGEASTVPKTNHDRIAVCAVRGQSREEAMSLADTALAKLKLNVTPRKSK